MSTWRLIGIDLAWAERNASSCAELVEDGGEPELSPLNGGGDRLLNRTAPRAAAMQSDGFCLRCHAGAYLAEFSRDHRVSRPSCVLANVPDVRQLADRSCKVGEADAGVVITLRFRGIASSLR